MAPNQQPQPEITHQQALDIISRLLNPSADINKQQLKNALQNYLISHPEINIVLPKNITADFLTALQAKIYNLTEDQEFGQTIAIPAELLKQWQEQYRQAQEKDKQGLANFPSWPSLEQQIKLALKFQAKTEHAVRQTLDKKLPFLNPEEKEEIIQTISQHLTRDIVVAAQTQPSPTGLKQAVNSEFIADSIKTLQKNNSNVALAITNEAREKIAQSLAHPFLPNPQVLVSSWQKMAQIKISAAPSPKEIRVALQKYGIPGREAEKVIFYLQTAYSPKHLLPTEIETKKALELSLEKSLSLKTRRQLAEKGFNLPSIAVSLNRPVNNFYHFQAAVLLQPKIGGQTAISRQALYWSKRLNRLGIKTTPQAVENILRGASSKKIEAEISRLKKIGLNSSPLFKLKKEIEWLETAYRQKKLPFPLLLKIKSAWLKVYFLTILEKINPLSLKFYQFHFPQVYQPANIKFQLIKNQWNFLTQETPWGYILTPFARLKKLHYRFNSWRWNAWGGLVNKLAKSKKTKKALLNLPHKIKPSYWLRPTFWLRRGFGRGLFWLGKKLGKKGLLKIGALIHRYALKNLIKRQLARFLIKKGLASLLSLAVSGPVGAVITAALFVWEGIKTLVNKNKREAFKQLAKTALNAGAKIAIIIAKLIASSPFAFLGAVVGFVIAGPAGAVVGAIVGGIIDKGIIFFGGIGNTLGTAGVTIAEFLPQLAGGTAILPALGTTSLISVGGALGATAVGAYFIIQSTASAFVVPPPQTAISSQTTIFRVKKIADHFTASKGDNITYTITITSLSNKLTIKKIIDQIDKKNLTDIKINSSQPAGTFDQKTGKIYWQEQFDLNGAGTSKTFTYTAVVKPGVNNKTKITNTVTVNAEADAKTVVRKTSFTLNSNGNEIAQQAQKITSQLKKGFWKYWNHSLDYDGQPQGEQDLWNEKEYQLYPFHCYLSNNYPPGCKGRPESIYAANSMFWCTWLVIKSYSKTGHPVPYNANVGGMHSSWKGQLKPRNTPASQLNPGDVIFFKKEDPNNPGSLRWAHVAIIYKITFDNIYTYEANSFCKECAYTIDETDGHIQNKGNLIIAGFGSP